MLDIEEIALSILIMIGLGLAFTLTKIVQHFSRENEDDIDTKDMFV